MTKTGLVLLASDKINSVKKWENPDSHHNGKMTLKNIKTPSDKSNRVCKEIHLEVWENKKTLLDKQITYCLDDNNEWHPQ